MVNELSLKQKILLFLLLPIILYTFLQFGHSLDYSNLMYLDVNFADKFKEAIEYFKQIMFKNPTAFFNTINYSNTKGFFLLGIVMYFVIAVKLYQVFKYKKNFLFRNIEHGSSTWANEKEIKEVSDIDEKNFILSQKARISIDGKKIRRNMNILVIGGSGAGKTRFFLKPNILQMNTSYVVTDPKGEILRDTGHMLEKNGYKVKVLDLIDIDNSNNYNPFHYLDSNREETVLTLITTIMNNTNDGKKGTDPFWESSEKLLLQSIFFYILKVGYDEEKNINIALYLLTFINPEKDDGEKDVFDILFERYEEHYGYDTTIKCYKAFKSASGKTLASILISVNARLSSFLIGKINELTSKDELELDKLGVEKTALFIITSVGDTTFNSIASMVYTQLFQVLDYEANRNHGGSLPIQVRFLLDEFANLGKIPNFEKILAYARSLNIGIVPIFQSFGQLKEMYEKSYETIVDNCDTLLFLGGKGNGTTEYISKMLGKTTITSTTNNNSYSNSKSVSVNENILGRNLMTEDEIARMDAMECLVFIKGFKPFKDSKYDIVNHKNYKFTYEFNSNNNYTKKLEEE